MVKVTNEQMELIERVVARYNGDKAKAAMNFVPSKSFPHETFIRCMVEGYELKKSREEQVRELYAKSSHPMRHSILRMLDIFEVKVEGVNDHEA